MTILEEPIPVSADAPPRERQTREARFEAFVPRHLSRARRMAARLLDGDLAAAEDVTQDSFLRAWSGLDRFRDEASLDTWFYRILVRQAANHRRWRGLRRFWTADGADPGDVAEPRRATDPLLRGRIYHALGRLSTGQREAFVLAELEGLGIRGTAEVLGKAEGTIKSHLARARATLRTELADTFEDGR